MGRYLSVSLALRAGPVVAAQAGLVPSEQLQQLHSTESLEVPGDASFCSGRLAWELGYLSCFQKFILKELNVSRIVKICYWQCWVHG